MGFAFTVKADEAGAESLVKHYFPFFGFMGNFG